MPKYIHNISQFPHEIWINIIYEKNIFLRPQKLNIPKKKCFIALADQINWLFAKHLEWRMWIFFFFANETLEPQKRNLNVRKLFSFRQVAEKSGKCTLTPLHNAFDMWNTHTASGGFCFWLEIIDLFNGFTFGRASNWKNEPCCTLTVAVGRL